MENNLTSHGINAQRQNAHERAENDESNNDFLVPPEQHLNLHAFTVFRLALVGQCGLNAAGEVWRRKT